MKSIVEDYYEPLLAQNMVIPCVPVDMFAKEGRCWQLDNRIGEGYYWIYSAGTHFNIKIHDFWFREESLINLAIPECLSVTYYQSISGEELNPYRRILPNMVKSFLGGYKPFKAIIHKNIPIRCVGIEFEPQYYQNYLQSNYPGNYQSPQDAFRYMGETADFPELVMLLMQVKNYRGEGLPAHLFYEAKAAEALSLIFERQMKPQKQKKPVLSELDTEMINSVIAYINDHYADKLSLRLLAKIACMGTTKLKSCFKAVNDCTITDYIQSRRLGQAEHLLAYTELTVGQVAQAVGYSNAGRFAALFHKNTGILPGKYIKIARRK